MNCSVKPTAKQTAVKQPATEGRKNSSSNSSSSDSDADTKPVVNYLVKPTAKDMTMK